MDTRKKLKEAEYFLKALPYTHNTDQFYYTLSAFLSAWRSVLDVMLYDFAEHYNVGLTRKDKMYPHDFWIVAHAQKHANALEFFSWWNKKIEELSKNKLWKMRPEIVHRGYPEIKHKIYVPDTISSGSIVIVSGEEIGGVSGGPFATTDFSSDFFEVKASDVVKMCNEGFVLMESIVNEAEKKFGISLT